LFSPLAHTHTYMHKHTHTQMHTHALTCMHAHTYLYHTTLTLQIEDSGNKGPVSGDLLSEGILFLCYHCTHWEMSTLPKCTLQLEVAHWLYI